MSTTDEREHDPAARSDAPRPAVLWTGAEHEAYLDSRPSGGAYNPAAKYGDPDWREPESDAEAAARAAHLEAQPRDPVTQDWVERVAALQQPELDRAHEQLADAELDLYQAGHFRDPDELDELRAARDQAQARVDVLEHDLARAHAQFDLQDEPEDPATPAAGPGSAQVAEHQEAERDQVLAAGAELDEDAPRTEQAPSLYLVQVEGGEAGERRSEHDSSEPKTDQQETDQQETDQQETDQQETDQQETGEAEADEEEL